MGEVTKRKIDINKKQISVIKGLIPIFMMLFVVLSFSVFYIKNIIDTNTILQIFLLLLAVSTFAILLALNQIIKRKRKENEDLLMQYA